MSAHAGIAHCDQRPIDRHLANRLAAHITRFGPDGYGEFLAPGLAMIHRSLHVTFEDGLEHQPFISDRGCVMTWDGRLDNRDDLRLQLWRELKDDTTDVALAMAAYEKWGDAGLARLIGDWSLAVWTPESRDVTLACDYAANRSLFYSAVDHTLIWSTSLAALVSLAPPGPTVEPQFAVGFLTSTIPPGVTPYSGVFSVRPGHVMRWTRDGAMVSRRFWDLNPGSLRYRDGRDYEAQFRLLFRDAVRSRLRARRPVWAELSGGFDSSAIVCMADAMTNGVSNGSGVETVSYFTKQAPASNELRFIEAVERHRGREGHRVALEVYADAIDEEMGWTTPGHPSGAALRECQLVREYGSHVLLSGAAGDAVTGNAADDPSAIRGPLGEWRLRDSLTAARAWARASERPIWEVLATAVSGGAPKRRAALSHRHATETFLLSADLVPLWIAELERRAARAAAPIARSPLARSILGYVDSAELQSLTEYAGVRCTLPFMHRPLVEFILATPSGVVFGPGQPRALMKRALHGLLPSRIAERISKGYVMEPFRQRAVRAFALTHWNRTRDLQVVQRRLVDERRLAAALEALESGRTTAGNLWHLVKLERWLRQLSEATAQRQNRVREAV